VNRKLLHKAADEGVISHQQVEPLIEFIQRYDETEGAELNAEHGEEQLKFVRNFGDIFITLGILFVAVSVAAMDLTGLEWLIPTGVFLLTSEWLVRVRRLALPGIALLLATLSFIGKALGIDDIENASVQFLILSVCALLYYLRYRMPFSLMPVAGGIVAAIISQFGLDMVQHQYLFSLLGLGVFSAAMFFDARDPHRNQRYSDCAFWLHLLASPLIVHGMMTSILFSDSSLLSTGLIKELGLLLFFVLFMLTALLVDRRAMLVSSLAYAIYAIFQVMEHSLFKADNLPLFVFIGFGIFIVFFGTYWYKARRLIFRGFAGTKVAQYLPPL